MNFYIHKIQLWFTREDADHVTYEFEPNKVNVIELSTIVYWLRSQIL